VTWSVFYSCHKLFINWPFDLAVQTSLMLIGRPIREQKNSGFGNKLYKTLSPGVFSLGARFERQSITPGFPKMIKYGPSKILYPNVVWCTSVWSLFTLYQVKVWWHLTPTSIYTKLVLMYKCTKIAAITVVMWNVLWYGARGKMSVTFTYTSVLKMTY